MKYAFDRIESLTPFIGRQATRWHQSRADLGALRQQFAREPNDRLVSIAVAGSLSRMEVGPLSDCDLMLIADENGADGEFDRVWSSLQSLAYRPPRRDGIYSQPVAAEQLVSPDSLGKIDESMRSFGIRMELLQEAQPVFGDDALRTIVRGIVARYADASLRYDPRHPWSYLLCDLVRYQRSLCISGIHHDPQRAGAWRLRYLKLRTSRSLLCVGLICLLGESLCEGASDPASWLSERLPLTPLERVAFSAQRMGDASDRWAVVYDGLLSALESPEVRERLNVTDDGEGDWRRANREFRELELAAIELSDLFAELLWKQRARWPRAFSTGVVV